MTWHIETPLPCYGMDGLAFYDCLQEKDELKHIPALIMSANAPIQEIKKRKIASIRKPFSLDDLLQKIEEILAA